MPADGKTVVYAVTASIQSLCRLNDKAFLSKLLNVHGCPSKGWSGGSFRGSLRHHCTTGSTNGFVQVYNVKCFKCSKTMRHRHKSIHVHQRHLHWGGLGYMKRIHGEVCRKGKARKGQAFAQCVARFSPQSCMNLRVIMINEQSSEGTREEMKDVKSKGHPVKGGCTDALL